MQAGEESLEIEAGALPFAGDAVAKRLLAWYGRSGRDLPWRHSRDPYLIWLSEIMLQQTGVEAVIPYYQRFVTQWPRVELLAAAAVETVIEQWAGLGYYRRARNLHAAACQVVEHCDGRFPADSEALQSLPGIGRSTAGAILALAFDRPEPILDGNVRRVLCRLFAFAADPHKAAAQRQLWAWAAALTSRDHPHDYTQAVMDLGATLCTPRRPRCPECPLQALCQGYARGRVEDLPVRAKRQAIPLQQQVAVVVWKNGRILVCRRGLDGMLGGLWEFPSRAVAEKLQPDEVAAQLAKEQALRGLRLLGGVRHTYSHFRLDLKLYGGEQTAVTAVAEGGDCRWLSIDELATTALHGAHRKALPLITAAKEQGWI